MAFTAYIIPADPNVTVFPRIRAWKLLDLVEGIADGEGCYVEHVALGPNGSMWLDEEGKLKGLEPNVRATALALMHQAIFPTDYIAGTVVVCGRNDDTGENMKTPKWLARQAAFLDLCDPRKVILALREASAP